MPKTHSLNLETLRRFLFWGQTMAWAGLVVLSAFFWLNPSKAMPVGTFFVPTFLSLFLGLETSQSKRAFYPEWLAFFLWGGFLFTRTPAVFNCPLIVMVGSILILGHTLFNRLRKQETVMAEKVAEIERSAKSISEEVRFYQARLPHLKKQVGTQEKLSRFAGDLGTLLDNESIKKKFIETLTNVFPGAQIALKPPALERDPIDHWITEKRSSIFVKHFAEDTRFPETLRERYPSQSILASPLILEKHLIGLVRVDYNQPNLFSPEALEELELYTHTACLGLENAQLFKRMDELASRDGLTGLATHRVMEERLEEETRRAARYHKPCSFVLLDIDHFKHINDNFGHLAGDEVLKEVARIFKNAARPVDLAARYGGEEFALVLPEMDLNYAVQLAESIRATLAARPIQTQAAAITVTGSLGCAAYPSEAASPNQLVRLADERLYRAKHNGRNQVVFR